MKCHKGLRLRPDDFKMMWKIIRVTSGDPMSVDYLMQRAGVDTVSIEYYQEICKKDF